MERDVTEQQLGDPEQAWFWSDRWQELERQAQADIDAGRVTAFETVDEAISALGENKIELE